MIEKLHVCTWEFSSRQHYVEIGVEFNFDAIKNDDIMFYISVPYVKEGVDVTCLMKNLSDDINSRFIFNDIVLNMKNIGEDARDGKILYFENKAPLTIVPCEISTRDGLIIYTIRKPKNHQGNLYFRSFIKLNKDTVDLENAGIARKTHTYDFKINESRNIPQNIYELKKEKDLEFCVINNVFCFHVVPEQFELSFLDSTKMTNVRKLEAQAFKNYLQIQELGVKNADSYNIIFLKDKDKESYSFFSIFNEEMIGKTQIGTAIAVNILCSALFSASSWLMTLTPKISGAGLAIFILAIIIGVLYFVYFFWLNRR